MIRTNGKPVTTPVKNALPVLDKFTQKIATHVSLADETAIKAAIEKGVQSEEAMRSLPSFQRKDILLNIASQIKSREEEIAQVLTVEVGKTIKESKIEVGRAIDTFTLAAEEECDFALVWSFDHKDRASYVSLRSISDKVDLSALAKKFGGGGHPRAAAFKWTGDIEDLFEKKVK